MHQPRVLTSDNHQVSRQNGASFPTRTMRPFDLRIRKIRQEIQEKEGDLVAVGEYVQDLPPAERPAAIAALQKAYDVGQSLGEMQHTPPAPPVDPDGELKLGDELRAHLKEARQVQQDIDQLRNVAQQIFHERTKRKARRRLRFWRS